MTRAVPSRAMLVLGIAIARRAADPARHARLVQAPDRHRDPLGLAARPPGSRSSSALEYYTLPRRYWHSVGFGLLVASYVLILAFCARNLLLRGMSIVLIGIACNALVIALNQGMPVKFPPEWRNESWAQATVKHHPQQHGEKLLVLSDIIILKHPYDVVMSFGDLILAVGLCDVAYNASRDPQRARRRRAPHGPVARLTAQS